MARKSITPTTDGELYDILAALDSKIADYKVALNVTLSEENTLTASLANCRWMIDLHNALTDEKEGLTKIKDKLLFGNMTDTILPVVISPAPAAPYALAAGIWETTSKFITKLKIQPNYSDEIGEILGIVGPEIIKDFTGVQAELNLKESTPLRNEFTFPKLGADGIKVLRYISATDMPIPPMPDIPWETVAIVHHSPYIDTLPNKMKRPESRYYMIWLMENDKPVGLPSDPVYVPTAIYFDQDGNELSGIPK